jgi:hypothetical protein
MDSVFIRFLLNIGIKFSFCREILEHFLFVNLVKFSMIMFNDFRERLELNWGNFPEIVLLHEPLIVQSRVTVQI